MLKHAGGVRVDADGMTINGQYGYYITDSHPWIFACYKGEVDDSSIKTALL